MVSGGHGYDVNISTLTAGWGCADIEQVYVTKPVFSSDGGGLAALFHALVFAWCQAL